MGMHIMTLALMFKEIKKNDQLTGHYPQIMKNKHQHEIINLSLK